jgi:D-beta-D-heptose 7-phosphate kinase/D-beta-D-heptose 1-phosphate adenosyltransferase
METLIENNGIVWVNGCFDVLHIGHIKLLKYAKSLGSFLIVGIDSDDRIKKSKGELRPINPQYNRFEMITSLKFVDTAVIFDSDDVLIKLIQYLNPEHMVVGEEYKGRVVGGEYAKNIHYFSRIADYSSTNIINSL